MEARRRLQALQRHLTASSNAQILVATIPKGALAPENFSAVSSAVPEPAAGEVLLEVLAITIGAGQRAGLQGSASYAGAAKAGVLMRGTGIGRVVRSRAEGLEEGDLAMGPTGWQEWATVPAGELTKVPAGVDPELALGALGTNGLTAFFGLLEVGQPEAGDTVVVSGAAGSVGHLVGQIAKIKGCRVVGVAGSDAKCAALKAELGFDEAVNYKSSSFRAEFKAATPERIGCYFDNTGGPILNSALFRMKTRGRVVCCGNVSQYDTSTPGPGPRGVPGLLVNYQVRMEGFIVYSFRERFTEARRQIASWVASGKLKPTTTVYHGLEAAPQAFVDLLRGATRGTTVVRVK